MMIRHDPDIGHIFVPNLKARIPGEAGGYTVITNDAGFRSNDPFPKSRGPLPRILIFGDSYTAGDDVSNEDRFSDRLAALLNAEVQNYAVPGTGADQHLLTYRKFASDVEADLVIVCVQIDSFHRIQVAHRPVIDRVTGRLMLVPKPYYELVDGELTLRHVPVPLNRPEAGADLATAGKHETDWYRKALAIYHRTPMLSKIRNLPTMKDLGSRLTSEVHRQFKIQPYPDITSPQSAGWRLMKAILERFIADAKPTPVLIVPIPTKEFYFRGVKPIYQDLFAVLDDSCGGVHVADVSTKLSGLPWTTRKLLHYEQGSHFTPLAHKMVAEEIAHFIRRRGLLGSRRVHARSQRPTANIVGPRAQKATCILGLSCFYHNSAAGLVRDGKMVAAAEEERFTRLKNDRRFPVQAMNYCLEEANVHQNDLAAVVYYDNFALTFERLCHSIMSVERSSAESMWMKVMPSWLHTMLRTPQIIRRSLHYNGPLLQGVHHRSHAASCFFASPFKQAAILTMDGVGEWATASIGVGKDSSLRLLKEMRFPHSLGLLYSAFTQFTGFKVNSGEYKMMGLAPYGEPRYVDRILEHLLDLKEDGSIQLNLSYFGFLHGEEMTNEAFAALFGGPRRKPESRITRREMDLASSVQAVTEEAILRMARTARKLTGEDKLCLAGGVALNCVANGRLLREGLFADLWIQPAAGDSGCAAGAALDVYHSYFGKERTIGTDGRSLQGGSFLGPEFSDSEIRAYLETFGIPHRHLEGDGRGDFLAECLAQGKVVGHFAGRLEYGPRSLGARSILGDPRIPTMQADLNLRIKYRESFRPFAPAVLADSVSEYFDLDRESPYMLLVAPVRQKRRLLHTNNGNCADEDLLPIVRQLRSDIPAVTHVDYSARIQTVRREYHAAFYDVLEAFRRKTGCAVLVNTSFNIRGEPIVCTPPDAYRCFMRTDMDVLALGNFILLKSEQLPSDESRVGPLETEDVNEARPQYSAAFLSHIKRAFVTGFWPASRRVQSQKGALVTQSFDQTPSTWVDANEPDRLAPLFEIPDPLLQDRPNPKDFVRALTHRWLSQSAAATLAPALLKLIKRGLERSAEVPFDKEVSDSVYVMY